jgi:formylglycine-generating enzyme required for sulfatase activity
MDIATPSNNLTLHRYKRRNKCLHEELGEGIKLTLMLIPAGEFLMGAPESEPDSNGDERPQHPVKLESFLLGCYPVTQAQWRIVAGYRQIERKLEPEPSRFKGDNRPVEQVSWEEAVEFCQRLSVEKGRTYRLPTEAEWEYACRAGTQTPFHYGEIITTELANYDGNYTYNNSSKGEFKEETTDVGIFPANRWGLHDLHGNVLEWCEDDWHSGYEVAPKDGSAWLEANATDTSKLLRGGCWNFNPRFCRSAFRFNGSRDYRYGGIGFRVCCVLPRTLLKCDSFSRNREIGG